MTPPTYKACPQCQKICPLTALECPDCKHIFRTKFPVQNINQTQGVPIMSPPVTSHQLNISTNSTFPTISPKSTFKHSFSLAFGGCLGWQVAIAITVFGCFILILFVTYLMKIMFSRPEDASAAPSTSSSQNSVPNYGTYQTPRESSSYSGGGVTIPPTDHQVHQSPQQNYGRGTSVIPPTYHEPQPTITDHTPVRPNFGGAGGGFGAGGGLNGAGGGGGQLGGGGGNSGGFPGNGRRNRENINGGGGGGGGFGGN